MKNRKRESEKLLEAGDAFMKGLADGLSLADETPMERRLTHADYGRSFTITRAELEDQAGRRELILLTRDESGNVRPIFASDAEFYCETCRCENHHGLLWTGDLESYAEYHSTRGVHGWHCDVHPEVVE